MRNDLHLGQPLIVDRRCRSLSTTAVRRSTVIAIAKRKRFHLTTDIQRIDEPIFEQPILSRKWRLDFDGPIAPLEIPLGTRFDV